MIGVSAAKNQALVAAGQTIPPPQSVQGLVDTGASGTCVDPLVFAALQLQPTGAVPMLTPSTGATPALADTYDVSVSILTSPGLPPLQIANMPVSASELFVAQGFHVLVGRDILKRCVLMYNGTTGLYTLAY